MGSATPATTTRTCRPASSAKWWGALTAQLQMSTNVQPATTQWVTTTAQAATSAVLSAEMVSWSQLMRTVMMEILTIMMVAHQPAPLRPASPVQENLPSASLPAPWL